MTDLSTKAIADDPASDASPAAAPGGVPSDQPGRVGAPILPADPEAYDAPRAAQARARGLAAPYVAGGRDPDPEIGRQEERFYLRILLVMVVLIVLSGFVLGALSKLLGG
ncbi:MAG TPA: hypothetical protein VEX41_10435 [Candidatus Eisenbacteria bacterium]|nr:hypothetical protein [Candidatus Eisenbacteria bacterium]